MFDVPMYEMDRRLVVAATSMDDYARHVSSRVLIRDVLNLYRFPIEDMLVLTEYLSTITSTGYEDLNKTTIKMLNKLASKSRICLFRVLNWGIGLAGPCVPIVDKAPKSLLELDFQAAVNTAVIEILTDLKERLYAYDKSVVWRSRLPGTGCTSPASR